MDDKNIPDAKPALKQPKNDSQKGADQPQWANSLRNLYDSVVDEPIPDSFKDLLDQFDEPAKGKGDAS